MNSNNYNYLSFFSGALGMDSGLESAGLTPLAYNEFDRDACKTIRKNRPDIKLYDCDIRELTATQLSNDLELKTGDLFMMCGGPPCQAFSTAGKRLGLNDERGNVFLHFINLIGELLPKYIIIENVRGLLSAPLVHRPHNMRGSNFPPLSAEESPGGALSYILRRLRSHGYELSFNLYNTANFGVPQIRERVIMFGVHKSGSIPDLIPTHDEEGRNGLPKWKTFREAVEGLTLPMNHMKFPEKRLKFYRMLKPGQNWRALPEELQQEAMGKSFFAGGGKTGFYRRLSWDKPSPTVVTSPTMPATDLAHPTEDRPLSVQEYARIQTFSDSWVFEGNLASKYKQIGNAVPVEFGKRIGLHLVNYDQGLLADSSEVSVPLSRYRNTNHSTWTTKLAKENHQLSFESLG